MKYVRCKEDLYSLIFKELKKFTKFKLYEVVKETPLVLINNQKEIDSIEIEGWEEKFEPVKDLITIEKEKLWEI